MRWTIGKRIFAALTIASLVIVGFNAAATRWSFQRGFVEYVSDLEAVRLSVIVDDLAEVHDRDGSWQVLQSDPRVWDELFRKSELHRHPPSRRAENEGHRPPPGHSRPGHTPPADLLELRSRVTLLDAGGELIKGRDIRDERVRRVEIIVNNRRVGELLVKPQAELTEQVDLNFANEQTRSIIYIGVAVVALAAVVAALISKQLVRPIATLKSGTQALTLGEYQKRITVVRDDELGDLAHDFNLLAETLQTNQRSRRQWVSDISHELRTPLAILSGELQAIEDGVRRFDDSTQKSLQAEVDRLQKLVADLHELTLSDEGGLRYDLESVNVVSLLRHAVAASETRAGDAGLELQIDAKDEHLLVLGDSARLDQLFLNLIENSVRYTQSPGAIEVGISATEQQVVVMIADSPPGVSKENHKHMFDRLFRVDGSRNRATGGSGLGLSICEAIVTAHSGEISAGPSHLGGVSIRITLPRQASTEGRG